MTRSLLTALLLLTTAGCGGSTFLETLPSVITPGPYDTATGVLSRLGEPCGRRRAPDGTEAWDYCGVECPPPGISPACAAPCADGCPRGWTFYLLSGVVVRYEVWGGAAD